VTAPALDPDAARRDAATILRLARRYHRARVAAQRGRLWAVRASLLAPARAAREALHALRTYGDVTAHDAGISRARQFAWTWWLNLRHEYDGDTVYRYRLFSRARALPTPRFLQFDIAALLYRVTIGAGNVEAAETLADKRRFAEWCARHALPSPPILAAFEGGRVTQSHVSATPPATDLFAKWGTRYGGDATQRWTHVDGRYVDDAGRAWTLAELLAHLAERSTDGVVVLQPRLVNHQALRPLSPNALSTLRVMTTRRPGAAPRLFAGLLRMGTGTSTADNFAQGGVACAVDPATGVAGEARRIDEHHRTFVYTNHPDTGARIAGVEVPRWHEAVRLALDAHARLGDLACVGWDVAVLEDGPVLLEGNWNPCTKLLQVATQTPLLATDFASVYAEWLAQPSCHVDDARLVARASWQPV
jgi:hypothetical protein